MEVKNMILKFVWHLCERSDLEKFQHLKPNLLIFFAVPDIQRWLTGGLVSLLILTFITLIIYKIFKIELVLWYRNSVCAFASKEGMCVWPGMLVQLACWFFSLAITSKEWCDCLAECVWNFLEEFSDTHIITFFSHMGKMYNHSWGSNHCIILKAGKMR